MTTVPPLRVVSLFAGVAMTVRKARDEAKERLEIRVSACEPLAKVKRKRAA